MKHITVLGVKTVTRSKFLDQLELLLQERFGEDEVKIVRYLCGNDYWDRWRKASNLITWGIKWTNERYRKETGLYPQGKNTLYVENGLYDQSRGLYVDDRGYFGGSSMVENGTNKDPYSEAWLKHLVGYTRRSWGWNYGEDGGDPNGPIIVALQTNNDAPMQHFFPGGVNAQPGRNSRKLAFLEICKEFLPAGREVIVRAHPKERTLPEFQAPDNWRFDDHKERIYPMLRRCSALVTVNSTVATEAMALNIPIATVGYGSFKGTEATLNCAENHALLQSVYDAPIDREARSRYLCRLLKHHQTPYGGKNIEKFIGRSEPLARWIDALHDVDSEPTYRKQFAQDGEAQPPKEEPKVVDKSKRRRRKRKAQPARKAARLVTCVHCGNDTPKTNCSACRCKSCNRRNF